MIRLARALLGLSPRERRLLALLALVGLPAALWLALAEPLLARRDAARTALAEAEELRGWLIAQRRILETLPAPADAETPRAEGLSRLEARLQAAGLTPAALGGAVQLSDAGEGAVSLRLERVGFVALMDWLESAEAEGGYRLASLSLGTAAAPGEVAADLRLEPLRRGGAP